MCGGYDRINKQKEGRVRLRRGSVPATSLDRYTRNVERNNPNKKAGEKRKQPKQKGSQKGGEKKETKRGEWGR